MAKRTIHVSLPEAVIARADAMGKARDENRSTVIAAAVLDVFAISGLPDPEAVKVKRARSSRGKGA